MPVEAELKAKVRDPVRVRAELDKRATGQRCTYVDTYFDFPDQRLTASGHELRVRTITTENGDQQVVLTFKEPAISTGSGSKPEHETTATDATVLHTVLTALGVRELIAFEKQCTNYRFIADGRNLLATLVQVPELNDQTFLELETLTAATDVDTALQVVRSILAELGIRKDDLTDEAYTDAVAARRRG